MTEKEAIEIFEKVHYLREQFDMQNDIASICCVLSQYPIDMYQVRALIDLVNRKHMENTLVYKVIFPPKGNQVSLTDASDNDLICDLRWKLDYLQAKQKGKTIEEFCKTMKSFAQGERNGGLK